MAKFFDDNLSRQIEEIERVTLPFNDLQRLVGEFEKTTGAARFAKEIAELHKPLDIMQQLSAPSALELAMREDAISKVIEKIGSSDLLLHEKFIDSISSRIVELNTPLSITLEEIGASRSLIDDTLRALDLHSTSQQIQKILAGPQIDSCVLRMSSPVDHYVDTLRDLQKQIAGFYNNDLFDSLNKSLQESIFPSLVALKEGVIGPAAGLMITDPLRQHGIFSWEWPSDEAPVFGSAIFFAAPPSLRQIPSSSRELFIECQIVCSICGDPMLVENEERYWNSPRKLTISIDIVPLCSACTQRADGSPEYWLANLSHLIERDRPALRLIRGRGTGSTGPKKLGHLRLVKPEENED